MHLYGSPRSAGLPMTRNMPFSSTSVPHRSRNMTGIYLGLEGNARPPRSKSAIPPLARGRGMSYKVRTPAEDRRYKMVEGLRIKEEKRGFTGRAIRNCKSAAPTSTDLDLQGHQEGRRRWGPGKRIDPANIDDLIRPNPRNFTTVSNSGVTRSERLVGWVPMHPDPYLATPPDHITSEVAEEVHKIASSNEELAGLEECYRRICKGNIETLYSLLPSRRSHQNSHNFKRENVGFTVRSYRNPAKAEILAEFPDPHNPQGRPRTVPIQRPLVPSPYFFRHNQPPHSAIRTGLSSRQHPEHGQFDDASDYLVVPRILAAPGAGGISKTLQYKTSPLLSSLQLITGKEYMSQFPPTSRSADEIAEPAQQTLAQPSLSDIAGTNEEETVQTQKTETSKGGGERVEADSASKQESGREMENISPIIVEEKLPSTEDDDKPRPRLTTSNSGADIMLGLETDDGKSAEVEIDSLETDELKPEGLEIPKGRVRKTSIVEKLSKSKESEMIALSIMESAGQRQRDFEKLINEHQELVQEISRTPSTENIPQSEVGRDP